ncbi:phage tail protein I [Methylovirgula sp. 4M-Z18]|uniref:phage tail protein I n=1 Tax=Methylovirgula sp. 4M-Z18 TaxID=2293567 RepID=UPI0018F47BD7|nr:phage tail protein I [Methylovirgula sp. 4M-Z18]
MSLLPPNGSTFESVLSLVSAARRPLNSDIIRSVWNPATCPLDLLPYLAWGLGLELWDDSWSEQKKRDTIANIWKLKREKTTLAGISAYVDLVGSEVVAARRPRDKVFAIQTLSDAERAAQMALMPQIHIYPAAQPVTGDMAKAFFAGDTWHCFYNAGEVSEPSDAAARYEQRAVYVDAGVTSPVYVRGLDQALDSGVTVALASPASTAKAFLNTCWSATVLIDTDADNRTVAITPQDLGESFAVPAGLTPTEVRPIRVAESVALQPGKAFCSFSYWGGDSLVASDAETHVYDQVTLFDSSRLVSTHRAISFWGWSHFALAPYSAELTIDIPLQRPTYAFGSWWGVGVWYETDMTPLWNTLEAVSVAQALRDDIDVNTVLYTPINFETGLMFGSFNFGDYRKAN